MIDQATPIAELLIAVAYPDRHEDSPTREEAWKEIKRRDAERTV